MSRPPYPHRCLGGDPFVWACRCKATPDIYGTAAARDGWGSGCRVAMEVRIADLEIRLGAAHDQLSDIAALARGEMEPDVRSGGAPVLGAAWEAVKALRARAERAEAENANLEDMTDRLDRQAVGMTEAFGRLEAEAQRLRDLVRHQRGALHDAELITDEEYADLAADAGAVARLRGYDEMRRESRADADKAVAAALEARAKEIDAKADAAGEASDKAAAAGDHYRANSDAGRWAAFQAAARIVRGA